MNIFILVSDTGLTLCRCTTTLVMESTPMDNDIFETPDEAKARSEAVGCSGYHVHEVNGSVMYMPCKSMTDYERRRRARGVG